VLSPTGFDDDHVFWRYHDSHHRSAYHNTYEPQMSPVPISRPIRSYSADEDLTTGFTFPHDTPRQRYDLPMAETYTFELEQSLAAGTQNESFRSNFFPPHSIGEGPSRPRVAEPPFARSLISPPSPAGLGHRYEQHEPHRTLRESGISAGKDAGLSSMLVSSVSFRGA